MKSPFPTICAVLGIGFAFTSTLASLQTLVHGITASRQVAATHGNDPAQLSAVIGETIIALISRGVIAIIPALLLYLALVPLRLRKPWFYSGAHVAACCLLIMFPFGTVCGGMLLVMLRRRRPEFAWKLP
ncbi:hypothetical protein [Prosthecobacter sp.]|uniref:hypothetical protein n=1 Tax=Prosthecobacter sp. TaxID=1965333 RepID=UPI003784E927